MNLSAPFIRRPVATVLLSLAIMLLGAVSFRLLPVAPLPNMDFPVIVVSASLAGASPEVMASTVATPLERSLGSIAGVNTMTSNSSQGTTRIILQFDLNRDINGARGKCKRPSMRHATCCPAACAACRPTRRSTRPRHRSWSCR